MILTFENHVCLYHHRTVRTWTSQEPPTLKKEVNKVILQLCKIWSNLNKTEGKSMHMSIWNVLTKRLIVDSKCLTFSLSIMSPSCKYKLSIFWWKKIQSMYWYYSINPENLLNNRLRWWMDLLSFVPVKIRPYRLNKEAPTDMGGSRLINL